MAALDTYTTTAGVVCTLNRNARAVSMKLDGDRFTAMVQERDIGKWYVSFAGCREARDMEGKSFTGMAEGVCYAEDMLVKARTAWQIERDAEEAAKAAEKLWAEAIETEWAGAIRALDARGARTGLGAECSFGADDPGP